MTDRDIPATPRIAPYARISDTDEDRAPGIDRQLRTVLPLIQGRGGIATREYVDNDKSAYKEDVIRDEGFEPWLADFAAGKNDGIAAFDLDRLFRQTTDLNRVIQAYCHAYFKEGRPKPALWLPSGSIDLTDEDGQMMATVLVAMAKNSSGKTAKRAAAFYRDEAIQGRIYTNYPAYYRNADGTINPERAATVLKAIDDVLAGVRPTAIATEWRNLGVTTARGEIKSTHINGETVRRMLMSPGIAGLAVYKSELLVSDDGSYIKRRDGGLIDEATWHEVCSKLQSKPGRRNRPTKALLSKHLRCGLCGSSFVRIRRSDTFFVYGCRSADSGGCAKVAISGPKLDAQITTLVLNYLREPVETAEDKPFEGEARLEAVRARIAELMTAFRADELPGSVVFPSIKQLQDEQKTLEVQAAKYFRSKRRITTPADEWETIGLERQQAIIDMLFEAIVILPADKGRASGGYNPDRVQPIWREITKAQIAKQLQALLSTFKSGLALAA